MTVDGLRGYLLTAALLALPWMAAADVITEWNERAVASSLAAKQLPFVGTRTLAIVHTAMFDAVNSIAGRYAPYRAKVSAAAGASQEAAAVAAAHATLVEVFPDQKVTLDSAYAAALTRIPDGAGKTEGIAVGEKVAAQAISQRASDGSAAPNTYRPVTSPGVYITTTLPIGSQWGSVTPWLMERGSQFRPGPPPSLTSAEWARDCNEIKDIGGKKSTLRSAEQTDIARFWVITGPASWDPIARQLADVPTRSLIENARLFALVETAAADAYIAVFDAKYTYNFWRPITAIRNGDLGGNPAVTRVADWEPVIDTPLHPEYPCAHCITSAAAGTVLEAEFGRGAVPTLTMTSTSAPGVVRKWGTIKEWMDEVSMARIYGGIHYRNSMLVGQEMGRKIGALAVQNYLRPAH
ncbi:MAG TPA: vanadium-dependent haloperoxidase [Terriglobales bacterium]|nr:vanadium-dependent haloperoxidase [Terriglobales bacterium]